MSFYSGKFYSETAQSSGQGPQACGPNVSRPWKAVEIAAMAFGLMVFWPLGLSVVGWKFWQKRSGYEGDLVSFLQEKWNRSSRWASHSVPGFRSSGNVAFDDWREKELARLEEERRKLAAAEQKFANYMATLRRARDREEFDRFMNDRRSF